MNMHKGIASLLVRFVALASLAVLLSVGALGQGLAAPRENATATSASGGFDPPAHAGSRSARVSVSRPAVSDRAGPFSRVAFGGGISLFGVHLLAATNLNRHLDLRGDGHLFQYNVGNYQADGFNITPRVNLASAGVSLDFYPFPRHGLRLTPGMLFYNHNEVTSAVSASGGTITLDGNDYYASASNPVTGTASLTLHSRTPAFTVTTGWGSFLHAAGRHWTFPFEIGVAFIGAPAVDLALTSGQTCDYTGQNCINVASNQQLQKDLQAQAAKYKHDMDPLKTFPILGAGIVYSFGIRSR